jgi:hypothetical protein
MRRLYRGGLRYVREARTGEERVFGGRLLGRT